MQAYLCQTEFISISFIRRTHEHIIIITFIIITDQIFTFIILNNHHSQPGYLSLNWNSLHHLHHNHCQPQQTLQTETTIFVLNFLPGVPRTFLSWLNSTELSQLTTPQPSLSFSSEVLVFYHLSSSSEIQVNLPTLLLFRGIFRLS